MARGLANPPQGATRKEPLVVTDTDGGPQEDLPVVHCLGSPWGEQLREFLCPVLSEVFPSVFAWIIAFD